MAEVSKDVDNVTAQQVSRGFEQRRALKLSLDERNNGSILELGHG